MPNGHTIFLDDSIDVYTIPVRPYDFNKGDRRFNDLQRALDHAEQEAGRTSIRQVVRKDSSPTFTHLWLVQAVGS